MSFGKGEVRKVFTDNGAEVPSTDVIKDLCQLHTESLEAVKTDLTAQLDTVTKERDDLKKKATGDGKETVSKETFDNLQAEFDKYKNDVAAKETAETKSKAYKKLLKDIGIEGVLADTIVKGADMSKLELEGEEFKDSKTLTESLKTQWADYTPITIQKPAPVPPKNPKGGNAGSEPSSLAEALHQKFD